jgi:hypothetical protein
MLPHNRGTPSDKRILADVALQHLAMVGRLHCHFSESSAKVPAGRTQAVYFSQRGTRGNKPPAFQEYWSRGCRRALALLSVFVCWLSWQLAQRKKSQLPTCQSRLPPSQPIPASTSNILRRADQQSLSRHAPSTSSDLRRYFGRQDSIVECDRREMRIVALRHRNALPYRLFQTSVQILQGGLSARLQAVLKAAAVPIMQDRSI